MADIKNVYQVVEEMGNSPAMVKKHYFQGVTKAEARRFWSITAVGLRSGFPINRLKASLAPTISLDFGAIRITLYPGRVFSHMKGCTQTLRVSPCNV